MNNTALALTTLFSLLTLAPRVPTAQDERPSARVVATAVERMAGEATRIADEYVAAFVRSFPEDAELNGLPGLKHDSLSDNSPKGRRAWEALEDRWARELAKIDTNTLIGRPEWVTLGFVKEAVESSRQMRVCHNELWAVNQLFGWQAELPGFFGPVITGERRRLVVCVPDSVCVLHGQRAPA